jgi:hypothetical protein
MTPTAKREACSATSYLFTPKPEFCRFADTSATATHGATVTTRLRIGLIALPSTLVVMFIGFIYIMGLAVSEQICFDRWPWWASGESRHVLLWALLRATPQPDRLAHRLASLGLIETLPILRLDALHAHVDPPLKMSAGGLPCGGRTMRPSNHTHGVSAVAFRRIGRARPPLAACLTYSPRAIAGYPEGG